MPKLSLKRTPEEEAARRWRKKERRERREKKERKRRRKEYESGEPSSSKRSRVAEDDDSDSNSSSFIGPSSHSQHKPDYASIIASLEESRFREKMLMAFEEDEGYRLDSVEARFNEFAHVPRHWGGNPGGSASSSASKARINYDQDEFIHLDPKTMDDEEYAEWIRMGMYRKTHPQEHSSNQHLKSFREAQEAAQKAHRVETKRLEALAAEERRSHQRRKEYERHEKGKEEYQRRWRVLLDATMTEAEPDLGFNDIPWPILTQKSKSKNPGDTPSLSISDLTKDAISAFLFPSVTSTFTSLLSSASPEPGIPRPSHKSILHATLLYYHPDKFQGRVMHRVEPSQRPQVEEALGVVVRVCNELMHALKDGD